MRIRSSTIRIVSSQMFIAALFVVLLLSYVPFIASHAEAARLWTAGCDWQGAGDMTPHFEFSLIATDPTQPTINSSVYRTAPSSCAAINSAADGKGFYRQFRTSASTNAIFTRFYFRPGVLPSQNAVIAALGPNNLLQGYGIVLQPDGGLRVVRFNHSSSSYQYHGSVFYPNSVGLNASSWYRIEWRLDGSSTEIRVTNASNSTYTHSVSSLPSEPFESFLLGNLWTCTGSPTPNCSGAGPVGSFYFDDIAVNDAVGTYQNAWPGSGSVHILRPNAAGSTNSCSTGSWSSIDEVGNDNDTSYCELDADSSSTEILDVNVVSPSAAGISSSDEVKVVHVGILNRQVSATGNATLHVRLKSASSAAQVLTSSSYTLLGTTYTANGPELTGSVYPIASYVDPTTLTTWAQTGTNSLENMQIGVSCTDCNPNARVTSMWALVEVGPSSGPGPGPGSPTVNLVDGPITITAGNSTDLTWTSTNADSCTGSSVPADPVWDGGGKPAQSGAPVTVSPSVTTVYTLECENLTTLETSVPDNVTVVVNPAPIPAPGPNERLNGYSWSENVGWFGFSGPGYTSYVSPDIDGEIVVDDIRRIHGYAWSGGEINPDINIGWISFDNNNLAGCPVAPCTATMDAKTGAVYGWARACSVFASGCSGALADNLLRGDWEGWISLRGTNYGLLANGTKWTGYAWGGGGPAVGSENIGWVQIRGYTVPPLIQNTTTFGVNAEANAAGTRTLSCGTNKAVAAVGETVTWSVHANTAKVGTISQVKWYLPTATAISSAVFTAPATFTPPANSPAVATASFNVSYASAATVNPKPGWATVTAGGRTYVIDCDGIDVPDVSTEPPSFNPSVLIASFDLEGLPVTPPSGAQETVPLTFNGSVRNNGSTALPASVPYTNQFEIQKCDPTCTAYTTLTTAPIAGHGVGATLTTSASWTPTVQGNYRIRLCADKPDPGSVNEGGNEGNNCSAWSAQFAVAAPPPPPVDPVSQGTGDCRPSPSVTQINRPVTWTLTGTITGGSPPLFYEWDFSDGLGDPSSDSGVGLTSTQVSYATAGVKRAKLRASEQGDPSNTTGFFDCTVLVRVQTFTEF